jgi:hypothetical protein
LENTNMSGFQKAVNQYLPIGVEGDFASANPRASAFAGEGGLIAGPNGVTVGRFAWIEADGRTVTNSGEGATAPDGYVHREQGLALITQYLGESANLIPAGFPVTLQSAGDFLIQVRGIPSYKGAPVYANFADGTPLIATAAPAGATGTGSIGATFTATGTGQNLTVTAVTGFIAIGDAIAGTGVPVGTSITGQTSGTTGGAGVYTTSVATTAAAATVTSFGNVLNVTAVTGTLAVGDPITGTGVPANATIFSQVSGTPGGVGVYTLNVPATAYAASTALTTLGAVLTKWTARNAQPVGALAAMSTW